MSGTGNDTYKGPGVGRSVTRVEDARGSQQEMRSGLDRAHEITDGSLTWELRNGSSILKRLPNPVPVPEPSYRSMS